MKTILNGSNIEISVEKALLNRELLLVDVRSPDEYCRESIPGAVNIPLFEDQERIILGKLFHEQGSGAARQKGLEIAAPRLPALQTKIMAAADEKTPVLYCQRGGLRSKSLTIVLNLAGVNAWQLKGGYRAFRRFINRFLGNYSLPMRPVVLHGLTGTGKTIIIRELIRQGMPAIDLEELACHRGSVFGAIGFSRQRSQKDFEALLWCQLEKHKDAPYLILEKEGRKIGNLFVPPFIVQALEDGIHLLAECSLQVRAERIVEEYAGKLPVAELKQGLITALGSLSRRLGREKTLRLATLIESEQYREAALILCRDYYDRHYFDARPGQYEFAAVFDTENINRAVDEIMMFLSGMLPRV